MYRCSECLTSISYFYLSSTITRRRMPNEAMPKSVYSLLIFEGFRQPMIIL